MAGGLYLPAVNFAAAKIGGQVPQVVLNKVATSTAKQQMQAAGDWAVARIIYGTDTLGADLWDWGVIGNKLVLLLAWGYGPWDGCEEFLINDAPPAAGVSVTHYDGTQTTHDPLLAQLYGVTGDPDRLAQMIYPNLVYTVAGIPGAAATSWPNCKARWRGRKLFDPRTGLTAHSDNAALALADFKGSSVYGPGRTIIWDSVVAPANRADESLGGQKRNPIDLTLSSREFCDHWADTLRTYADCWILDDGQSCSLVADMPGDPVMDFDHDAMQILDIGDISFPDPLSTPNIVEIEYTDTSQTPWRTAKQTAIADGVDVAGTDVQLTRISMPGIHNPSQAARKVVERLNRAKVGGMTFTMATPPRARVVEPGDLIRVRHPIGLNFNVFRVTSVKGVATTGRYEFSVTRYDPAFYSDKVVSVSTIPDTDLPNPTQPPSVTDLVVAEENYQPREGTTKTRFKVTWTLPAWPWVPTFKVVFTATGMPTIERLVTGYEAVSDEIVEDKLYTISVFTLHRSNASIASIVNATAQGKKLPPSNVPWITVYEVGGEVHVTVGAALDIELSLYEARYDDASKQPGVGGETWKTIWEAAKQADTKPADSGVGATIRTSVIPSGTWRVLVCARDRNKTYSLVPTTAMVTVTQDSGSFLISSFEQTAPTLTNMAEYSLAPWDSTRYFVTEDNVPWDTKFPNAMDTYVDPLATYHAAVTSTWLGEAEDVGLSLGGNWTATADVVAISGAIDSYMGFSESLSVWDYVKGLAQKQVGRFVRLMHQAVGAATLGVMVPRQTIRVDAVGRTERHAIMTATTGRTVVRLTDRYVALKGTPKVTLEGATGRYGLADNIRVNSYDSVAIQIDSEVVTPATNQYVRHTIKTASYVIQAGDTLCYDSMCAQRPQSEASLRVVPSLKFSNGQYLGTYVTLPDVATIGVWESFAISLAPAVGLTVTKALAQLSNMDTATGIFKGLLRAVRIEGTGGVLRLDIWQWDGTGSPPAIDASLDTGGTNQQAFGLNHANAFDVYGFDIAGARIVSMGTAECEGV